MIRRIAKAQYLLHFLGLNCGPVLLLLGVSSIPRPASGENDKTVLSRHSIGTSRNPFLVIALMLLTFNTYYWAWLYIVIADLRKLPKSSIPFSPLSGILGMLVPVFNIYWLFFVWHNIGTAINSHISKADERHFGALTVAIPLALQLFLLSLILAFALSGDVSILASVILLGSEFAVLTLLGYTQVYLNCIWQLGRAKV